MRLGWRWPSRHLAHHSWYGRCWRVSIRRGTLHGCPSEMLSNVQVACVDSTRQDFHASWGKSSINFPLEYFNHGLLIWETYLLCRLIIAAAVISCVWMMTLLRLVSHGGWCCFLMAFPEYFLRATYFKFNRVSFSLRRFCCDWYRQRRRGLSTSDRPHQSAMVCWDLGLDILIGRGCGWESEHFPTIIDQMSPRPPQCSACCFVPFLLF